MANNSLYRQLDTTCTAAIVVNTSCNALWVTRPLRHGMYLPAKSSLKAGQNIYTFVGTVPTACHVTPQNTFFVP